MSTTELQKIATASTAVVEVEQQRAVAEVQAAMLMAARFPRDVEAAKVRILERCTKARVADDGVYEYNRGGENVVGPSIRLAEVMAQELGNLYCGVKELSRRDGVSECLAFAWDLERNVQDSKTFQVRHWRDTKKGGYAVTDERDIYEVTANMAARRKRACLMAVIPQEIQEEAVAQCERTLAGKAEPTPERLAAMLEKFAPMGVTKEMIEARIGRNLEAISAGLLMRLGRIYNSIRDGMSTARDWFEVAAPAEEPHTGTAGLRAAADAQDEALKKIEEKSPQAAPESSGGAQRPLATEPFTGGVASTSAPIAPPGPSFAQVLADEIARLDEATSKREVGDLSASAPEKVRADEAYARAIVRRLRNVRG